VRHKEWGCQYFLNIFSSFHRFGLNLFSNDSAFDSLQNHIRMYLVELEAKNLLQYYYEHATSATFESISSESIRINDLLSTSFDFHSFGQNFYSQDSAFNSLQIHRQVDIIQIKGGNIDIIFTLLTYNINIEYWCPVFICFHGKIHKEIPTNCIIHFVEFEKLYLFSVFNNFHTETLLYKRRVMKMLFISNKKTPFLLILEKEFRLFHTTRFHY
jgi:hypothetical protein